MSTAVQTIGYRAGLAAFGATLAYDVAQILQVAGVLRFPFDEILIYGTSLGIVVPFVLELIALHQLTGRHKQLWSHAAVIFASIYAVFVSANYVVQLATVVPAKVRGALEPIRLLEQTPHSLFWDYDAAGYVAMGLAALFAAFALDDTRLERRAKVCSLAHAFATPLICVVYFHPTFSTGLLLLGSAWAVTAPLFMVMIALVLRDKPEPAG